MCRLYGFRATEPTKVECSLVRAQNALMAQSRKDMSEGLSHGHGWGVVSYADGLPHVKRQAWAAYHGEHFKKVAARAYSRTVLAHVRRATVGAPGIDNTHPFLHGRWAFAHNGTVPNFEQVRMRMIEATSPLHRNEIHGTTDTEHIFRLLMSLHDQHAGGPLLETLRVGLKLVIDWCREIDPNATVGLNVLWTDGEQLVGSKWGRPLWYLERDGIHVCEICGESHLHHHFGTPYRAVEVASEPITSEAWLAVPDRTVYAVDPDMRIRFELLEEDATPLAANPANGPV